MLTEIVRGQEKAPIVLIEDSLSSSGLPLLRSFVLSLCNRNIAVHSVHYEHAPDIVFYGLNQDVRQSIHHHEINDPLQWLSASVNNIDVKLTDLLTVQAEYNEFAVVIDSVSKLALHSSISNVCQQIVSLSHLPNVVQIIMNIHSDLHDPEIVKLLEHISSAVLKPLQRADVNYTGLCSILHKRLSGKITRTQEHYTLSDCVLTETIEYNPIMKISTSDDTDAVDPAANLTFNLSLSDKEKKDRSDLVLPYVKQPEVNLNSSSAKIFYQPDDADDFDEEDPDDDLDI